MGTLSPTSIKPLLHYWRNTLADEDLMGIHGAGSIVITTLEQVRSGTLDAISIKSLQRAWEDENRKRTSSDRKTPEVGEAYDGPVPVIILARGFAPKHEHGKPFGNTTTGTVHYTLHIPATVAPTGSLHFTGESLPWIGRQYLLPNEDTKANIPIVGEVDSFDSWLNSNPVDAPSWNELIQWCDGLWKHVVADRVPDSFTGLTDARICLANSMKDASRNLCQLYDALLREEKAPSLLNRLCQGRTDHVVVDDKLRRGGFVAPRGTMSSAYGLARSQADAVAAFVSLPTGEMLAVNGPPGTGKTTLLQSIIATEVVARAMAGGQPAVIVGTSTNNQAVENINRSLNEILRDNPAVSLFPWARRWVPELATYGLSLPAGEEKVEAALRKGFEVAVRKGQEWTGFPEREKDPNYLSRARSMWLEKYQETYDGDAETVESGLETLRSDLVHITQEIQSLHCILERFSAIDDWWRATSNGVAPDDFVVQEDAALSAVVHLADGERNKAEASVEAARKARDRAVTDAGEVARTASKLIAEHQARMQILIGIKAKVNLAMAPHGFLEVVGEAIPLFRGAFVRKQISRLCTLAAQESIIGEVFAREARDHDPTVWAVRADQVILEVATGLKQLRDAESKDSRDRNEVTARAKQCLSSAVEGHETAARKAEEARYSRKARLEHLAGKINELAAGKVELRQEYRKLMLRAVCDFAVDAEKAPITPELPSVADFDWLLDVTLRHMAFQKAMRYWEGRWIVATQDVQDKRVKTNSGRAATEARFRRWCMLMPCLIITFHSLPKHFQFSSFVGGDNPWKSNYMLDFIDLLIVDEAGQAGPHVGAAAFALASRAIIVGDTYQIEPISRITRGTDRANCSGVGLAGMWIDGDPASPHVVSEPSDYSPMGSIMRLAQLATVAASSATENEPGILLTEHRRCRAEIVEYCNRLVYNGRLQPLSPPRHKDPPVPPMAWAHVRGSVKKVGNSNSNQLEAEAISRWIAGNAEAWTRHYDKPIEEIVAVVTPFGPQTQLLKASLAKAARQQEDEAGKRIAKITFGTVHALQGAEKPIVVFSPTYSADTAKCLFFDRKPNMLNVAVSRAKDSFVVIGDMRLFRRKGGSPSSILGEMLFANETNELPGVDGNHRFPRELVANAERISTLDRHREVLRRALADAVAGQKVVIASPWITMKAIEDDGLVALVADAVQRRGAQVQVVVDGELSARNPEHRGANAIAEMTRAGATVSRVAGMHSKTLITGSSEIIEGSFNWLSANRHWDDRFCRHEISWRIFGDSATNAIQSALKEFEGLRLLD